MRKLCALILTCFFILGYNLSAQVSEKNTITLQLAKKIAAAAEAEAVKNKLNVVISVVDDGGNLVYLMRMDNTQFGSVDVSIQKAKSAIAFKRPTKVYEDMVSGGRNVILSLPGAIPIEGGIPLIVNGQYIGGIGVSGAKSAEDGVIAGAGADVLAKEF